VRARPAGYLGRSSSYHLLAVDRPGNFRGGQAGRQHGAYADCGAGGKPGRQTRGKPGGQSRGKPGGCRPAQPAATTDPR